MAFEDMLHPLLERYLRAPQWVKTPVGKAYSMIPPRWRRGRHYPRFQEEAALSGQAVEELARAKLARTLAHALQNVPAYRPWQALLKDLDPAARQAQLPHLPLLSKETLRANLSGYLAEGVPETARQAFFTGGTTSLPLRFYLHKGRSRPREEAYMEQFRRRAGIPTRATALHLRGFAVPGAGIPGRPLWMLEPIKRHLVLSTDHLVRPYMEQYVAAMRAWKPSYIEAFASALYPLAVWLKEHPAPDVTNRIRAVLLFSENVLDHQADLMREVFDCPVLKHYGHSERVLMAASMPDDPRYFFWPQYGRLELVDASGNPVTRPGMLGEIVGTGFDNDVMPLLRYRTGDMAILGAGSHPLLPGFPALERIEGRMQEFIVCQDLSLMSLNSLTTGEQEGALGQVDALQFAQREPGRLLLRVVAARPLDAETRRRIARRFEARIPGGCTVEVAEVDALARTPRGKQQMLLQELDIRPWFEAGGRA